MSVYEGGHIVPTIITYPNMIASNSKCSANVCHADFFATFADLFDSKINDNTAEDSFSNLGLWQGEQSCERVATVYSGLGGFLAIYKGDYKLCCCQDGGTNKEVLKHTMQGKPYPQKFELYNIKEDPSETKDLYDKYPEVVAELRADLINILDEGRSTKGEKQANYEPDNWVQINFKE